MLVDGPTPEIPVPVQGRRIRVQRVICLSLLPFLAIPLLLVGAGPFAPVDHDAPVGVTSVEGEVAYAPSTERDVSTSSVDPSTTSSTTTPTTTTAAPATTTAVPVVKAARKADPVPTTAAPSSSPAPTAPATTAAPAPAPTAPPTTVAPAPAPAPTSPPTTAAPRPAPTTTAPAPSRNRQSGQATWYRWRKGNCAHNSLPKGTKVTVTAAATGKTATCVVGDRGGFRNPTIIDLDASVFEKIAPLGAGRIAVTISW